MFPRTGLVAAGAVLAAALLAGCGSEASDTEAAPTSAERRSDLDAQLVGRSFEVVSATEGGVERPLIESESLGLSLRFEDDGTLVGHACNRFGGPYEIVDRTLVVVTDEFFSTLAACGMGIGTTPGSTVPDPMVEEDWFQALLQSEPTLALDGDQLSMTSGDTVVVLVDSPPPADVGLTGVTWELYSIVEGETVGSVRGVTATLVFGEDGTVEVDTGCNTGSGGYEVSGDVISFAPLALTAMACDEYASRVEAVVTGVLDGAADYQQEGNALMLGSTTGDGLEYRTAEDGAGNPVGISTVEPPTTEAG